ncbi:MAG TPA: HAD-IC family P-type ATPase [Chloroflexota bacterium]|nr:HAD-IC family P-type ATPase [Chloroflexota bacterium]
MVTLDAPTVPQGLSEAEAQARRAQGLGNACVLPTSRSYRQIFRENVFTFINNVLFGLGIALVVLGRWSDALVSVAVVLVNTVVGVVQEIRAKRVLDRIALLAQPQATVIRDGVERVVPPSEVVVGDILLARPGDQIVVDGPLVAGRMDADESLLTGESNLIAKKPGDLVYSGSYCVTGKAYYQAQRVGAQSLVNQLTASARAFRRNLTPLQREVNLVIRVILLIAVYLEILSVVGALLQGAPVVDSVKVAVVIAGLVPNGLFIAIAVAYALGALRIAGHGALVQQSNAIESLSNVDVLCLDKTGTLTANRIRLHAVRPLGVEAAALERLLGDYAANVTNRNRTAEALYQAYGGAPRRVVAEVEFSSARRWSALAFAPEAGGGVYVLGAPEVLQPRLRAGVALGDQGRGWAEQGLRVVLFAAAPPDAALYDAAGQPCLPAPLEPLGLIAFGDELRPEARETLAAFAASGIRLKIISGDNPATVAAVARQAGLNGQLEVCSGADLESLTDAQLREVAERVTIFGRITPSQKERLVKALRAGGHHVAMIGDGVNDVLALKRANLGIAMLSGSQATRAVADIVLLNDSFSSLPLAFREGQRILNGMQDILRIFLTRVLYMALLIMSIGVVGGFPLGPKQASLLALLTVGIPSIALAAWARPGPGPRRRLVQGLMRFVLSAATTLSLVGLGVYALYLARTQDAIIQATPWIADIVALERALPVAQSALLAITTFCGLLLLLFVEPPLRALAVAPEEYHGDWRPTLLAAAMLASYLTIVSVPWLRDFFELAALGWGDYLALGALAGLWGIGLHFLWRRRLIERFLDLDLR